MTFSDLDLSHLLSDNHIIISDDRPAAQRARHKELPETLKGEENPFLSMQNELYVHNPKLAKALADRLKAKATPEMARKLADLEKSGQALQSSLKDLYASKQDYTNMAKDPSTIPSGLDENHVITRLEKLNKMITKSQKSLELNRRTRADLIEWLLGEPLPPATIANMGAIS